MIRSGIILLLFTVLPGAFCAFKSHSETDGITIIADETQLYCDTLNCPETAVKCVVTKSSINNDREIQRVRQCFDANGEEVAQSTATEPNPEPGMRVNSYAEGSRSSFYSSVSHNSNSPNPEELKRITEQHEQMIAEGQKIHQQVQSSIDRMKEHMHSAMEQRFGKHGWW